MSDYPEITNPEVAAGAAITTALMTALRDRPELIAQGVEGAPRVSVSAIANNSPVFVSAGALTITGLDEFGMLSYVWSLVADDATNNGQSRVRMSNNNGSTWSAWVNLTGSVSRAHQSMGQGFIDMRTGLIVGTMTVSAATTVTGISSAVSLNETILSGGGNALQFGRTRTEHAAFFYAKPDTGRAVS